ncbi:MAG: type II secretion system protein M [Rhodanobacter sp.]|jgi:general secretion pathway protein M|nr:type II secretion system protein M [Rhodanobacter sp.]
MIAALWMSLAPRDRRILSIGAIMAVVLLGWALVWHPLARKRAELEENIQNQRRDLAYVQRGAAELDKRRATSVRTQGDRAGKSLLALADATARSAGLETALKRVEPVGTRGVRVSFESVGFDALVQWIQSLAASYGVETTELSADRADGIGLVNARVTLQDSP